MMSINQDGKLLWRVKIGLGLLMFGISAVAGTPEMEESITESTKPAANEYEAPVKAQKVDDWITEFTGAPLYPSQLGQPGWPGMVPGQAAPKRWGFPERLPYPGTVEHVRVGIQRYMPVVPIYNAKTLIKNFCSTELPDVTKNRIIDYAEPIYCVTRGDVGQPTGKFNRPVQVVKWDKSHPPIELNLGRLGIGTYAVRVIAATPTENVERVSKRLVINFDVNDGLTNAVNHYRKRCAAIDEFYSIVEFFFQATETQEYKVKLWVDDSTVLPVVYLHNIDLHNKLTQLACRAGKKSASLYDAAERRAGWKEKGTWKPDDRSREERLDDDAKVWNSAMPVNAQPASAADGPSWEYSMRTANLMVPGAVKDDGAGIDFYGKDIFWNRPQEYIAALKDPKKNREYYCVDLALNFAKSNPGLTRQTAYPSAYELKTGAYRRPFSALLLAWQYHETGDETKARRAAINLARLGLQNMTHGSRQTMAVYDLIPQVVHGDTAFRGREKEMDYDWRDAYGEGANPNLHPGIETGSFIISYDYLFPYIQNNQELADSLGRFIPWIKTPADVVRFYDTYVLQYCAHQIMTYNVYTDLPTAKWMARVIAVQQDPTICQPWIHWLFHYVWTYPNRPMGVDEIVVNAVGRDGTEKLGSSSYAMSNFLSPLLSALGAYKQAGGSLPLDMTDPERFPKAGFGERFRSDIMVAGGYSFWIGDVSGPDRQRLRGRLDLQKHPDKIPNNPSRILSDWGGILETGREFADFRQRRTVGVRVGEGYGHHHNDPLDLQIWAQGVPMCGDGGGRADSGYGYPATAWLGNHNTVMAKSSQGHRWISSFAPIEGAQYLMARVLNQKLYERQVVQVDVDSTNSYVVDVFRVNGDDQPTYAFHGMPADQFEVNAVNKQKGTFAEKFPLTEETKWSGTAPSPLVATWRMRRDPEKITMLKPDGDRGEVVFPGAERNALGPDFDEKAPRKFIRLHLLGHKGADVYGARAVCFIEKYTNENLYVKPKGPTRATIFPVVFEPYAGQPFIQSVRLLTKAESLGDSLSPVAIEVILVNGRRDIIYLAPREAGVMTLPGVGTFQGEYAFVSYDAKGVRQAALAGGTKIEVTGINVATEKSAYTGTIRSIDYHTRTAVFSGALPKEATNAVIETGSEMRPTSYALTRVDGTNVNFLQGMDFAMSRVDEITPQGWPLLRTSIPLTAGLTVTDERCSTFWKFAPGATRTNLVLTGKIAPRTVFKEGDALWVWEIGPGDPYRLPVQVNVVRQENHKYKTIANAPVTVRTSNSASAERTPCISVAVNKS